MTRKKVKLAYISNDSARKATFKKRKKGFLKKMYELATLCEIKACAIMYSPYDAQPEIWPKPMVAQRVLGEFLRLPEMEKSKKMVNQEAFLRQRINKAAEHLKKQQKENREKEMTQVMFQCVMGKSLETMNMVDLNDVGWLVDQNLKEIYNRVDALKKEVPAAATKEPKAEKHDDMVVDGLVATAPPPLAAAEAVGIENMGLQDQQAMQGQPWLMDVVNPHDQMGGFASVHAGGANNIGKGESGMMTFADYNHGANSLWSSAFFPSGI